MTTSVAGLATCQALRLAMLEFPFHEEDGPELTQELLERVRPLEQLLSEVLPSSRWALTAFGHAQIGIEDDGAALVAALHSL